VWLVMAAILAAVLLRSWFFLVWDESYFDSDQAIVGLMAKHLSEGRAWPLYFYGQEYMLGVESWVMAPVFLLLGPSVFSLRLTMTLINVGTALLLWRLLVRDARLGPWAAVLAASPFVLAPFVTAAHLVEAQGGNPEPFFWVLVLWMLRRRPIALGAAMGVAFLHREFTLYAAPALLVVHLAETWPPPACQTPESAAGTAASGTLDAASAFGPMWSVSRSVLRPWALTVLAFVVVTQGVNALKPYADLLGPGTAGVAISTTARDNVTQLLARAEVQPAALGSRFRLLVVDHLPLLVGLYGFRPYLISIGSDAHVGWEELLPFVGSIALVLLVWLGIDLAKRRSVAGAAFPVFLLLVGLQSAVVYAVTRDPSMFTFRYGLLALYVPVALGALVVQPSRPRPLRACGAAVVGLLAAASLVDHVVVIQRSSFAPPPVRFARLAARLEARGATVARGSYWRSYVVTFLTGERVKVASTDLQRISEYQTLADEAGRHAVTISEEPCGPGERADQVDRWYLCGGE
jgi:hypothetical protein